MLSDNTECQLLTYNTSLLYMLSSLKDLYFHCKKVVLLLYVLTLSLYLADQSLVIMRGILTLCTGHREAREGVCSFERITDAYTCVLNRVHDSRPMGRGFESYRRHCVVSLSKTHLYLLSTGLTQEDTSQSN